MLWLLDTQLGTVVEQYRHVLLRETALCGCDCVPQASFVSLCPFLCNSAALKWMDATATCQADIPGAAGT